MQPFAAVVVCIRQWGIVGEAQELLAALIHQHCRVSCAPPHPYMQEVITQPDGSQAMGGFVRVADPKAPPQRQLVPQFGYVSLFPLLMRLLPPGSKELGAQLALLRDPGLLWTPYGLRSLAASASLYQRRNTEHDPPYWRGGIWINLNLMAVEVGAALRSGAGAQACRLPEGVGGVLGPLPTAAAFWVGAHRISAHTRFHTSMCFSSLTCACHTSVCAGPAALRFAAGAAPGGGCGAAPRPAHSPVLQPGWAV